MIEIILIAIAAAAAVFSICLYISTYCTKREFDDDDVGLDDKELAAMEAEISAHSEKKCKKGFRNDDDKTEAVSCVETLASV
mmetsp:Transcript_10656/g.14270  ORF Transcript_10656/g.14270 Transcript_10656/m.14270 type:complete len:82 (-) Transcript_10656:638-883(-)